MKYWMRVMMKVQHAPTGWPTLSARQESRFEPVQTASKRRKFRIGGRIQMTKARAARVMIVLGMDEKSFARAQAMMPTDEMGGGSVSACSRRRNSASTALIGSPLHQGDAPVEPVHEAGNDEADREVDAHRDGDALDGLVGNVEHRARED